MKIRLRQKVPPFNAGETVTMTDANARRLVSLGAAEEVKPARAAPPAPPVWPEEPPKAPEPAPVEEEKPKRTYKTGRKRKYSTRIVKPENDG